MSRAIFAKTTPYCYTFLRLENIQTSVLTLPEENSFCIMVRTTSCNASKRSRKSSLLLSAMNHPRQLRFPLPPPPPPLSSAPLKKRVGKMHPSPTLPEKKPLPLLLAFLRNLNLRRPKIYRASRKKRKENRSSTQQPFYHAEKGENHIISRRWLTCWLCRLETTDRNPSISKFSGSGKVFLRRAFGESRKSNLVVAISPGDRAFLGHCITLLHSIRPGRGGRRRRSLKPFLSLSPQRREIGII